MPQDPQADQDFSKLSPSDQHAYLMDTDSDYAKLAKPDQGAYLQHISSIGQPNEGLAPPASPLSTIGSKMTSADKGPVMRNVTSFGAQVAQAPGAMARLAVAKRWPIIDAKNFHELGQDIRSMNPLVQEEGQPVESMRDLRNIDPGASAANVLPYVAGGIRGMKSFGEVLPSADRAGTALEGVKQAIGHVPVQTAGADNAAMDALIQHERGGGAIPPPIKKYIQAAGGPTGMRTFRTQPMDFATMRDFASNAGRMSAKDLKAMSPTMKNYLNQFAKSTSEANEEAAAAHGQGEPYTKGINEYRRAMKMRNFGNAVKDTAIKAAVPAALGATGYGLYRSLMQPPR